MKRREGWIYLRSSRLNPSINFVIIAFDPQNYIECMCIYIFFNHKKSNKSRCNSPKMYLLFQFLRIHLTQQTSISTRYQIYLSLHLLIRVSSESRESFAIYDPAECNARVNNNWLIAKSTKFRSGHFSKNPPSRHAFDISEPRI